MRNPSKNENEKREVEVTMDYANWETDETSEAPTETSLVFSKLRQVIDPDLKVDIVTLNLVRSVALDNAGCAHIEITLTTPACPFKDYFISECEEAVKELSCVKSVNVTFVSRADKGDLLGGSTRMSNRNDEVCGCLRDPEIVIGVFSGKGGVGKSTIATNLAFLLARAGASVGLCDLDICGPSLPYLIPKGDLSVKAQVPPPTPANPIRLRRRTVAVEEDELAQRPSFKDVPEFWLLPVEHLGVRMMSYGYLKHEHGNISPLRGPMQWHLAEQLLTKTVWGALDYLIIDMPPGLGDIHLSLLENRWLDGAIVVTTPMPLSSSEVADTTNMLMAFGTPLLAMVENASSQSCPSCGEAVELGNIRVDDLEQKYPTCNLIRIPYDWYLSCVTFVDPKVGITDTGSEGDTHTSTDAEKTSSRTEKLADVKIQEKKIFPFVEAFNEDSKTFIALKNLSKAVITEMSKYRNYLLPDFYMTTETLKFSIKTGDIGNGDLAGETIRSINGEDRKILVQEEQISIKLNTLRLACACTVCEAASRVTKRSPLSSDAVIIETLRSRGPWGITVRWKDGHTTNASYRLIMKIAKSIKQRECPVKLVPEW